MSKQMTLLIGIFLQLKLNDLRGDGTVYYLFDVDRLFTRVNSNFEVISKGTYKYKNDAIFELRRK